MTTRKFITKSGDTFEWEETPEVKAAIAKLHSKPAFAGNYEGPLYAPHPDLKRPNEYKSTDS
tara:strand:+ start:520 stop:705 length:186 start_codon:yes stop_codon:yes gene_type:complete